MLYILIIGLIAGAVAGALVRGKGYGCLVNIIVGIIGAYIGFWLLRELNIFVHPGFIGTLITAVIGSVVFLLIINVFKNLFEK